MWHLLTILKLCSFHKKNRVTWWMLPADFGTRVASQAACNGPKSKNGKSWQKKKENGPRPEVGKKWPKKGKKWDLGSFSIFIAIFGPFFPHFGPRAIFYFWANFFPFLDFAPFSILYEHKLPIMSLNRGPRTTHHRVVFFGGWCACMDFAVRLNPSLGKLQKNGFPAEACMQTKCRFRGGHGRKPQEIAGGLQGSRANPGRTTII